MEEQHSHRNGKLKAYRASETEEQRKERLRIRREKETEDHKKQSLAMGGDENELERKLRLETAAKRLRRQMKKEKQD